MKRKEQLDQIEKFENELSTNDIYRMDRRTFVKAAGTAVGVLAFGTGLSSLTAQRALASVQVPQTPLDPRTIPKYVEALPTFIGVRVPGTQPLNISMENATAQVLPASMGLPGTKVWAYQIANSLTGSVLGPANYPAFTIESTKDTATNVTYANDLVDTTIPGDQTGTLYKLITVDQTLHWADPLGTSRINNCEVPPATGVCTQPYGGPVPAVTHLHGGEVPSTSDGGPDAWFTPEGQKGPAWSQGVTNNYFYPNGQEATTLWYHDHALGATRLNVYAGLAGFYFLRDQYDTGVPGQGLNLPAGNQEIEIVIQDRMFDTNGQWLFPDSANPGPNGPPPNPTVHPNWIPEFFGTTIVVNGKTWPFLNVEPRRYRFRFLDGSNARFYELSLMNRATMIAGPAFWQIGTDGGLLDKPVMVDNLLIAPGERADIIIDFSNFNGQTLTLVNSAKAPYPSGTPADPQTVGQIMQFNVNLPLSVKKDTSFNPAAPNATLRGGKNQPPAIVRLADGIGGLASGVDATVTKRRLLTLKEVEGPGGPVEVLVNNTKWDGTMSPNAGGITEMPQVGSTEVWEIVNLTPDAHPMHLHLTQFQLINRQAFNMTQYLNAYNAAFPAATFPDPVTGVLTNYPGGVYIPAYGPPMSYGSTPKLGGNPDVTPYLQNMAMPPDPNEAGWKDTFKMYPGEVTRIVVRWAPQDIPVGGVSAGTNAYPFDPTTGPGYVWHCHIVDHEDNEMMRPYKVAP